MSDYHHELSSSPRRHGPRHGRRCRWETILFEETIAPDPKGPLGYLVGPPAATLVQQCRAAVYLEALLPELRRRWEMWEAAR
jgi:hypothetical protein